VGTGVDARLSLGGVTEQQTITITVKVKATEVELETEQREKGNEVEAEGLVTAMSTSSLTVNSKTFTVTTSTQIVQDGRRLQLTDIHPNDRVHVHGTMNTGTLTATKIQLKKATSGPGPGTGTDDDDDDANEVEVRGTIDAGSLAGSCSTSDLSFKVTGTLVKTSATTRFKDTQCSALKAGDRVEVKGTRNTDLSIAATRVEKK
jgi:hypothetical protein